MSETNPDPENSKAKALARLAVLQRMRDSAVHSERASMFVSIDRLMEVEGRALRETERKEGESRAGSERERKDGGSRPGSE